MTSHEMLTIVQNQLAIDLNCTIADLNGEKDSFVFVEAKENPGRIPFLRNKQYFAMLTMGKVIIVSATLGRLKYAEEQLTGKSRDDAFSMPFIRGHSMHFLPDLDNFKQLSAPEGFLYDSVEKNEIAKLHEVKGFDNAIQYNLNHPIQNTFIFLASQGDTIAAMAGAFEYSSKIWSIGIDVLPEYRNNGLAAYLVNALSIEIINRDIVHCYGTSSSNIGSQRVAYRAGFRPAWMSDHKVQFEGSLSNS